MENLEIYDKVQACGTHTKLTFKKEFLKELEKDNVKSIYDIELYELFQKYSIQKFLHNPTGPACENVTHGYKAYWINGNLLDPKSEEVKKIEHLGKFNDKVDEILNSEDDTNTKMG